MPPDTDAADDLAWARRGGACSRCRTFSTPVQLSGAVEALPRSYIYCTRSGPGDVFRPFADSAKASPQWRYFELDASHNPHITMPDTLAALLHHIATQQGRDLERPL